MIFRYNCNKLARRGGFSLAEVIVAVGILALMMTLAGEVLSLTVTATGRAQALTGVNQAIRIFERTLREDLAAIDRETSVMLIQGNPINAYWTQDQKEADDDGDPEAYPHALDTVRKDPATADRLERPRADLLMFFTSRKEVTNYVRYQYPEQVLPIPRELRQWVSSTVQQVVYGHAELGEYVPTDGNATDPYVFVPDLTANPNLTMYPDLLEQKNIAPVPAAAWHLARRSLLFVPFFAPDTVADTPAWMGLSDAAKLELDDPNLSNKNKWDGLQFGFATPADRLPVLLNQDLVLLGATDVVADYEYFSEFFHILDGVNAASFCALPPIFPVPGPGVVPVKRSRLDPAPPPLYANRLGHYFLPNCASFKIEWALNPGSDFVGGRLEGERRLFWFDPGWVDPKKPADPPDQPGEGPLGRLTATIDQVENDWPGLPQENPRWLRLTALHEDRLGQGIQGPYSLQQRFGGAAHPVMGPAWNSCGYGNGVRANMAFFAASGRDTGGKVVPEAIFPAALRITVDLYDDQRRLGRPIRHVIIAKVGE